MAQPPPGSTWQTLPIPSTWNPYPWGNESKNAFQVEPPCYEPELPAFLASGRCSGEWTREFHHAFDRTNNFFDTCDSVAHRYQTMCVANITIYDRLSIPEGLKAGEYVLSLRYDCEASAQVWNS